MTTAEGGTSRARKRRQTDPDTWCLDVGQVEAALTPRTRAIMPVHIYGHPVDMDPLLELADQHDLVLIEGAAEAHGGQYLRGWRDGTDTWQTCDSFGLVSCFSFYANKIISTGEGGMNGIPSRSASRDKGSICPQDQRSRRHNSTTCATTLSRPSSHRQGRFM